MATTWTDELKAKVIKLYKDKNPTAENSMEIVKEIAEEIEQSPNGVRMILVQAGVYVKKEAADSSSGKAGGKTAKTGDKEGGTKRVSKEEQYAALRAAIEAADGTVDDEIITKLTGKAAAYFTEVLTKK